MNFVVFETLYSSIVCKFLNPLKVGSQYNTMHAMQGVKRTCVHRNRLGFYLASAAFMHCQLGFISLGALGKTDARWINGRRQVKNLSFLWVENYATQGWFFCIM